MELTPRQQKLYNVHYKQMLSFGELVDRKGKTLEEYAHQETISWLNRIEQIAEEEANEELVDVFTGKRLGKRKDVEARFS